MCFNATASISAFSIGLVCMAVIIYRKLYFIGTIYVFIITMQLLEYYGHIALEKNDKEQNKNVSSLILFLLFLQPVVYSLYAGIVKYKDKKFTQFITPIVIMFGIFVSYFYFTLLTKNDMFIGYLNKNCNSSICRLDWSFLKSNIYMSLIFLSFYFFLFIYTNEYFNISKRLRLSMSLLSTLFTLSLLYMIFVDGTMDVSNIISGFGSIWCISAVLIGPFIVMFLK